MAEYKSDDVERLTVRSALAAVAVAVVDHRVVFQLAVVCIAVFALRTWGPDDVSRGIDYVAGAGSKPVRVIGRAVSGMWRVTSGGLDTVDRAVRRTGLVPDQVQSPSPVATMGQAARSVAQTMDSQPGVPVHVDPSVAPPAPQSALPQVNKKPRNDAIDDEPAAAVSPSPIVWTLLKDQEIIRAEVHDVDAGADLLLFRNGTLWRRERWADHDRARAGAAAKRADFEKNGWVLMKPRR